MLLLVVLGGEGGVSLWVDEGFMGKYIPMGY